jgi:hypothetical protein
MDIVIGRPLQCARSLRGNQIQQKFFSFFPISPGFPGFSRIPLFFPAEATSAKKRKNPWPGLGLKSHFSYHKTTL